MERVNDINDVKIRRSKRSKRKREEWSPTIEMKVRASRASGTSATIEVQSLGGYHSHTCNSESGKNTSEKKKSTLNSESGKSIESGKNATPDTKSIEESGKSATPDTKPRILRCGWTVIGKNFIAPDGTKFTDRKAASKYWSKVVPKLEPKRQDGWQVYCDANNTHQDWVAPDGEIVHSFISAKKYAKENDFPFYGKDGRTCTIASFFGKKNNNRPAPTSVDDGAKPVDTVVSPHVTPKKTPHVTPKNPPRKFEIPAQSEKGAQLQMLCHRAGVLRNRRRKIQAAAVENEYSNLFTTRRLVTNNMTARVR